MYLDRGVNEQWHEIRTIVVNVIINEIIHTNNYFCILFLKKALNIYYLLWLINPSALSSTVNNSFVDILKAHKSNKVAEF